MKICHNPKCDRKLQGSTQLKFCSASCAAIYNNTCRQISQETRDKISRSLKDYYSRSPVSEETREKIRRSHAGRPAASYSRQKIKTIFDVSPRTRRKIINRLGLGCSYCGWKEASCDIHHIFGRKVPDSNDHDNLSLLCPNHHRMANEGIILPGELIALSKQWPDNWRNLYYG